MHALGVIAGVTGLCFHDFYACRVETESGGTRQRTGGEVKGKEANGVGSQAVFSFTRNSPSSVTTIVLPRPALQESQFSTELTPPPI